MTVDQVRTTLRERISRGATLDELETLLRMTRGLTERQRQMLWSEAWRYDPRRVTQRRMESARALFARLRLGGSRNGNGTPRAGGRPATRKTRTRSSLRAR